MFILGANGFPNLQYMYLLQYMYVEFCIFG